MSYPSESQWTPTGVICPICGHESLALGNRVKGHICIPDFLDTDVRFSTPSREDSFDPQAMLAKSLQDVAKSIMGVK